jgi:hypothetical protein
MHVFLSITLIEMGRPAVYLNPWYNQRCYNRGAVYIDIFEFYIGVLRVR